MAVVERTRLRWDPGSWLHQAWEDGTSPVIAAGLGLLAAGYRAGLGIRGLLYGLGVLGSGRLSCPVISIGNLTLGGSGKTPMVELAARALADLGLAPAVVSRGYGRTTRGVQVVATREGVRLPPRQGGDEPVLLAERLPGLPVVVGENRYEAARLATAELGAASIVLDDGFQNLTLARDLDVLVVNGRAPWGNGRLFPRGPLREPLAAARRAHLVVVTNPPRPDAVAEVSATIQRLGATAPVLSASYQVLGARRAQDGAWRDPGALRGLRLFAFAGLGSPEGFARTLHAAGIVVTGFIEFPDHHWYEGEELAEVARRARASGAEGLVTTEKDGTRLRHLAPPGLALWVLPVSLSLRGDEPRFLEAIRAVAARHPVRARP